MSAVYKGWDSKLSAPVALKIATTSVDEQRFVLEAELLAAWRHESLPRHVAHGVTEEGDAYIAMQWLEGVTLADCLRFGPFRVEETLQLGVALCKRARVLGHRATDTGLEWLPGCRQLA